MATLAFLLTIAGIFIAVLALETPSTGRGLTRGPAGLIGWLSSGNWPAKVGGGLLVVGIGALIRYGLLHIDLPDRYKLLGGVACAAALGLGAAYTRVGVPRRGVSLALGGAALGVAYLTSYSAFALFGFLTDEAGVALLAVTAASAAAYAIARSALSIALLSMVGAFLAPAFATVDPGPAVVYGYYCAAALIVLVMVALRGWRPLIHLSFLFTLAGGSFFAWTAQYFDAVHASEMLAALIVLSAVHVAMPLVERTSENRPWLVRLDIVYALLLPVTAALVALTLSPDRVALGQTLGALAVVWLVAAVALFALRRDGALQHLLIAVLLGGLAVAAQFRDLPWEFLSLAFAVLALWAASRSGRTSLLTSSLAGLVAFLGLLHAISTLTLGPGGTAFANLRFVERIAGAVLMLLAARVCQRARQGLAPLLGTAGLAWLLFALAFEFIRADWVSWPLLVHWAALVVCFVVAFNREPGTRASSSVFLLPLVATLTAALALGRTDLPLAMLSMVVGPAALVTVAMSRAAALAADRTGSVLAASLAPVLAGAWAWKCAGLAGLPAERSAMLVAAAASLLVLFAGRFARVDQRQWLAPTREMFMVAYAVTLLWATTIDITRSAWGIALEALLLAALGYLAFSKQTRDPDRPRQFFLVAIGFALFTQAMVLRWLGPAGELDIADIRELRLPAVLSLLWALSGAAATVWAVRRASRPLWIAGAVLLVAAVVKIVWFDFGSLGELGNILAVIAAGGAFLLVGWVAPFPPPAAESAPATSSDVDSSEAAQYPSDGEQGRNRAWAIAIVVCLLLPLAQCSDTAFDLTRAIWTSREDRQPKDSSGSSTQPGQAVISPVDEHVATAPPQLVDAGENDGEEQSGQPAAENVPDVMAIGSPETACAQWASKLPPGTLLMGAGGRGRPLDFVIDDSGVAAHVFEVEVNEPSAPVALLLSASQPAVWRIRFTSATRIAGVWTSGRFRQVVTGLTPDTVQLATNNDSEPNCPAFQIEIDGAGSLITATERLLGRRPDRILLGDSEGRVAVGSNVTGRPLVHGPLMSPQSFRDMRFPLVGQLGLDELAARNMLRRATSGDITLWRAWVLRRGMTAAGEDPLQLEGMRDRTYVVLGPLVYPPGLYGANAATFIVPVGVPRPRGNPGHSTVLDMNAW